MIHRDPERAARLVRLRDARRSPGGRNPCSGGRRESRFGASTLQPAASARGFGRVSRIRSLLGPIRHAGRVAPREWTDEEIEADLAAEVRPRAIRFHARCARAVRGSA